MLAALDDATRARGGLHVWSALFRVVEGRSLQGRLVARVPAVPSWTTADLDDRAEPATDVAGAAPLEDDPVITVELLQTVVTAPAGRAAAEV